MSDRMSDNKNRGKRLFANKMHRELFVIISLAALIPALIATVSLFYIIFQIMADQMVFPEAIAANLIPAARKVAFIIFLALPATIAVLLFIAHKLTHAIVGPFDRIVTELDAILADTKTGAIIIRKKDKFQPLVDRINQLIKRLGSA